MAKKIQLYKGNEPLGVFALVDDVDFEELNALRWHVDGKGYAYRQPWDNVAKRCRPQTMHRTIMDFPTQWVDHINGNRLDNRRPNLRLVTPRQNRLNRRVAKNSTSGYTGVNYFPSKKTKPWRARITRQGKRVSVGFYETPEEAAIAWNKAAIAEYGEFARLNVVNRQRAS